MYIDWLVGLSNSENFTITIVEIAVFTNMNTITIEDLLKIYVHKCQN